MGMRRVSVIMLITLIFIAATVTIVAKLLTDDRTPEEIRQQNIEYVEKYVSDFNAKNLDVMFYGMDPAEVAPPTLKARQIDNIEDAQYSGSGFSGRMLVVCDQRSNLIIQPEQMKLINQMIDGGNFYFVYLGDIKLDMLKEAGIVSGQTPAGMKSVLEYKSSTRRGGANAIADECLLLPIAIRTGGLSDDELPVYSFIVEMATKELYWR